MSTNQTQLPLTDAEKSSVEILRGIIDQSQGSDDLTEKVAALMFGCYALLRKHEGDDYVMGWLSEAIGHILLDDDSAKKMH